MNSSPLVFAGQGVLIIAQLISQASWFVYTGIIATVIALVLMRYLNEALGLNPFSRFVYYTTRPAERLLSNMRRSHIYYPLRSALNFDPAVLMLLITTALVCYVVSLVINYLLVLMAGAGRSLIAFGEGAIFTGARFLIGTVLLTVIFYLLAMMLVIFVNWIFGLFAHLANRARGQIEPLLRIFRFNGAFAGWSFLILGIALNFAATAVQSIFLS